jgi:Zn-dependent protease with chaperone function
LAFVNRRRLAPRVAVLLVLAVGFWALALGVEALLLVVGWGIITYAPDNALAGFFAWGLAAVLTYGFLPRWAGKKEASARPLPPGEEPRLHAFVQDVARRAGRPSPDALYLFHDANAFTALRRDRLFARRESIVGIGLPLLAVLDQDEVRSVLAHEMGHHIGGDVKLGPWVHRTRAAIVRAVDRLEGSSFWLHLPFVAYAKLFLRMSTRISREQELQADAVAAGVAGASATASALRKIEVLNAVWAAYFHSEVLPALVRGRLPPLLEGYEQYWRASQTPNTPAHGCLSTALATMKFAGEHDTHPPLLDRLAALGNPSADFASVTPALSLLDDVPRREEGVLREIMRDANAKLTPVSWDVITDEVWLPIWRDVVREAKPLATLTPRGLPDALERWATLADATRRGPAFSSPAAEKQRVARLLGAWLTAHLAGAGFRITAPPGLPVRAGRDQVVLEPFALVEDLAKRKIDAEAWARVCAEHSL